MFGSPRSCEDFALESTGRLFQTDYVTCLQLECSQDMLAQCYYFFSNAIIRKIYRWLILKVRWPPGWKGLAACSLQSSVRNWYRSLMGKPKLQKGLCMLLELHLRKSQSKTVLWLRRTAFRDFPVIRLHTRRFSSYANFCCHVGLKGKGYVSEFNISTQIS